MNTEISIQDVKQLRTEARCAGDIVQVVACDVALDEWEGYPDYSGGGHTADDLRRIREILRGGQEAAWALCVEAILYARGRS